MSLSEIPSNSRGVHLAPWGPSLHKDPQEHTLLRFHEERVSGRVLVTLTGMESAASAHLFPRRGVCSLWKGLAHTQGPVPTCLVPHVLRGPVWGAGLSGLGYLLVWRNCLWAVVVQIPPVRVWGSGGLPEDGPHSSQGSLPLGQLISRPSSPAPDLFSCGLWWVHLPPQNLPPCPPFSLHTPLNCFCQ